MFWLIVPYQQISQQIMERLVKNEYRKNQASTPECLSIQTG